jgi:hypothetical protein
VSVLEASPEIEAAPRANPNSRTKLIVLIVVGAILLTAAAFLVPGLLSGDKKDANPPVKKATSKKVVAAPTKKAPAKKPVKAAAPLKVRDPFKPLYTDPTAAPAAAAPTATTVGTTTPASATTTGTTTGTSTTGTTTAGTATGTTTTGTTTTGTTTTGTSTTGTTTTASGTTVTTTKVSLVAVGTSNGKLRASTNVDGTLYKPAAGDTFAKTYKLLSVSGSCGTYLFGDQKFALCVGQYIVH